MCCVSLLWFFSKSICKGNLCSGFKGFVRKSVPCECLEKKVFYSWQCGFRYKMISVSKTYQYKQYKGQENILSYMLQSVTVMQGMDYLKLGPAYLSCACALKNGAQLTLYIKNALRLGPE